MVWQGSGETDCGEGWLRLQPRAEQCGAKRRNGRDTALGRPSTLELISYTPNEDEDAGEVDEATEVAGGAL